MKKKSLFFLLFVMCVGWFIPKGVFAADTFVKQSNVYNNININYIFSVKDDNGNSIEDLNFVLYDKTKSLMFESEYNNVTKEYFFVDREEEYQTQWYWARYYNENEVLHNNFNQYVPYKNDLHDTLNWNDITLNVMNKYNLHGTRCESHYYDGGTHCNYYDYIPMILEETNSGKQAIFFATINLFAHITEPYWENSINRYYVGISLVNTSSDDIMLKGFFGDKVDENIQFMRNAIYDYSDELWEELNSGPIASSEITFDNSDTDLTSPKLITLKANDDKQIYSKYKSNINYKFKVKNGNGMNFRLHDLSNTFNYNSTYDKDSDTYSIVDNSSDNDYSEGIKEFSEIIINEVKTGKFNELSTKYNSITSDNCSSTNCDITTYIPLILEGENNDEMAKQIVLGLMNIQYREENGNDYYDVSLNVYNNTCDLLNSNIDLEMNKIINLSRSIGEDYSNDLMDKYSNGSISLEDASKSEDINSLKDKYCEDVPVISLRKISNPKTLNNGIVVLIISMMIVIGSGVFIIKRRNVKV